MNGAGMGKTASRYLYSSHPSPFFLQAVAKQQLSIANRIAIQCFFMLLLCSRSVASRIASSLQILASAQWERPDLELRLRRPGLARMAYAVCEGHAAVRSGGVQGFHLTVSG